ncbi:MAG: class I adenylate-forming enzyme family protein, partial [Victivallales bacterium]|nr:class I adenylate-forming enzyme family protein [Victivallales bacterium]
MKKDAVKIICDRFKASENSLWFTSVSNRDFTYGEFWNQARNLAEKWQRQGLRQGDVVAFILPNDFSVLCCYLACAIGGFAACPVVDTLHKATIRELLGLVNPGLVIDSLPKLESKAAAVDYRLEIDQDASFLIMFTSGATGTPKAICHSFRSVVSSAQAFAQLTGMTAQTRLYHILPMTYMAGFLNTMLSPLTVGASLVEGALFSPASAVNFWERPLGNGVNTLSIIPTVAAALC